MEKTLQRTEFGLIEFGQRFDKFAGVSRWRSRPGDGHRVTVVTVTGWSAGNVTVIQKDGFVTESRSYDQRDH